MLKGLLRILAALFAFGVLAVPATGNAAIAPGVGWWGPSSASPVIACEPNTLWVRASDNGYTLSLVEAKLSYGGAWNTVSPLYWAGGTDFTREYWFPLNTSQLVTMRGLAYNSGGTGSNDYIRYITDERWFVTGDFDGNSKGDFARFVADSGSSMSIWTGMSNGVEWNLSKSYTSASWSRLLTQAVAGDVDGDGMDEIVAIYRYGDNASGIWVFDWTGSGFTARKPYNATSGKEWYKMKPLCADIDGDKRDEFLTAFDYNGWNGYDTGIFAWNLEGASAAEPIQPYLQDHNGWWDWSHSYFLGGDFDGDGRDEVAAYYNYEDGTAGLWIFDSLSGGKFTSVAKIHTVGGWGFAADKPAVADVDGDGRDEIAHMYNYAGWDGKAVGLWLTDISGTTVTYSRPWAAPANSWDWTRVRLMSTDADGDKKDEVIAFYDYGTAASREAWGSWIFRPAPYNWSPFKNWSKATGAWDGTTIGTSTGRFVGYSTSLSMATSATVYPYNSSVRLSGLLKNAETGSVLQTQTVFLDRSADGRTWSRIATLTTGADGSYSTYQRLWRNYYYRTRFPSSTTYRGRVSSPRKLYAQPYLSRPFVPSTSTQYGYPAVQHGRNYTAAGYLKPRHLAGTYPARLYLYYDRGGKWVYYKSIPAKAGNYSDFSRILCALNLPYGGRYWYLRFGHSADSVNPAGTGPGLTVWAR